MILQTLNNLNLATQLIIISIFAACLGSFSSFISYRLANEESIFAGRSKCPNCQNHLKPYNLIPLFSWLLQRRKCSMCHAKISIRYPLIELFFIITFIIIFLVFGQEINTKTILLAAIATVLIIISLVDFESYFIPDELQYILAILAIFFQMQFFKSQEILPFLIPAFYYSAAALVLLAAFYFFTKKEAIGVDDIKFLFIAGFLLGMNKFLLFFMIIGFVGVLHALIWQKLKKEAIFPFAPALCLATFFCLLLPHEFDPLEKMSNIMTNFFLNQDWFMKLSWYWY